MRPTLRFDHPCLMFSMFVLEESSKAQGSEPLSPRPRAGTHLHLFTFLPSVVQTGLEVTVYPRMSFKSQQSSCLQLQSARIVSLSHHAWPSLFSQCLPHKNPSPTIAQSEALWISHLGFKLKMNLRCLHILKLGVIRRAEDPLTRTDTQTFMHYFCSLTHCASLSLLAPLLLYFISNNFCRKTFLQNFDHRWSPLTVGQLTLHLYGNPKMTCITQTVGLQPESFLLKSAVCHTTLSPCCASSDSQLPQLHHKGQVIVYCALGCKPWCCVKHIADLGYFQFTMALFL